MRALAALSRFVGNTFAYWVLIFAVLAFLVDMIVGASLLAKIS